MIRADSSRTRFDRICIAAFGLCVRFLERLAEKLDPVFSGGMDYVKINVLLFCIVLPIVLAVSFALNVALIVALIRR